MMQMSRAWHWQQASALGHGRAQHGYAIHAALAHSSNHLSQVLTNVSAHSEHADTHLQAKKP